LSGETVNLPSFLWLWRIAAWSMGLTLVGYGLLALIFSGFTAYLFYISAYAAYLYALIALGFSSPLSEAGRTAFLKQHFSREHFLIIRCVENILVVIPFIIGLLIYQQWLLALGVLVISKPGGFGAVNFSKLCFST